MNSSDEAKGEAVRQAYAEARQMKAEGVPADMIQMTIEKKLLQAGLAPSATKMLCANLPGVREAPEDSPDTGKKNMVIGGILLGTGILITWVTYAMIKNKGGYYIIATGPMLIGIGLLVKGFIDSRME